MAYPDLGETYWRQGFRGELTLANVRYQAAIDYGDFREVSGFVYGDAADQHLCVTIRTNQALPHVIRLTAAGVMFKGRLSQCAEQGYSGEVYRAVVGRLLPERVKAGSPQRCP